MLPHRAGSLSLQGFAMKETQHGGLRVRLVGGTDGEGGGEGPLIVLFHGFGAPGTDLVPLARVMEVPRDTRFAFPEAPQALPAGFGGGRAWWMLDMARFQEAMIRGVARDDLRQEYPEGLVPTRKLATEMVAGLVKELGPSALILGGFSQGAMLACDITLHSDLPVQGLALLSGAFVAEDWWGPKMAARTGLPVFQSHGQQDPILAFGGAETLRDALTKAGLSVDWHSFRGGHEIPMGVLDALGKFVGQVVDRSENV